MKKRIYSCLNQMRKITDFVPRVALVLGSGLGSFADKIEVKCAVNYSDIEGMPVSTALGHDGRFVFGFLEGVPVALMQGRVHIYEGYTPQEAVLPLRVLGLMGADRCIITNAAGGINPTFKAGDFMLISDHISFFVPSPLEGENIDELGIRFPDMTEAYDREFADKVLKIARQEGIELKKGVYTQLSGPSFETPAEIRALAALGADAVGMSTVCETIAARHMGMRVCGISMISNMAAGISSAPLTHSEVMETGERVAPDFERLITLSVKKIAE